MPKKTPYTCPRCHYTTNRKDHMRLHLYKLTRPCPSIHEDISLTEDIKQHILDNRILNMRKTKTSQQRIQDDVKIKQLEQEIVMLKNKKNEEQYQIIMERILGGGHEKLHIGITDITTPLLHAELKKWEDWKAAVGQLLTMPKRQKQSCTCTYSVKHRVSNTET